MDQKEIARERIQHLFELAEEVYKDCPELADSYVERARKIGMRTQVRIPRELKRRVCKHCDSYLVFGDNARVRVRGKHITVTCEECGGQMRYPY